MEDIRNKSVKELQQELADKRQALADLTLEMHTKEVKNVRKIRDLKKTIARILTILREKETA